MEAGKLHTEEITYGGVRVKILERANGNFTVYWREARKPRLTTKVRLDGADGARAFARVKARELAGKSGSRTVMQVEAEAIDGMKGLIGARSLSGVVEQLRDAVSRLGGWEHVGRAFENYLKAGHGKLDRAPVKVVVPRFLALYGKASDKEYRKGLKKELQSFAGAFPDVSVMDLTEEMLRAWIGRANLDGSEPGWRYFNNRLATWKTFLNRCRQWRMWVRDEDHPAEIIKPMGKVTIMPPIWKVEQMRQILAAVAAELDEALGYLVTGCWMGLRPFEMGRVATSKWDWEHGYLQVDADVARKVMSERFVPIPANVREMLYNRIQNPKAFWAGRCGQAPKLGFVRSDDQVFLSKFLRDKGLIKQWEQDVMRHSYISYRLAEGHGIGQVAEWAGNSEREIRKSYRRPLRKEDGAAWFGITFSSHLRAAERF